MSEDRVWVDFTQDEALVLLDWLWGHNKLHDSEDRPTVEEYVLGALEAMLERQVNVVFSPRYEDELRGARSRLRSVWGLDEDQQTP